MCLYVIVDSLFVFFHFPAELRTELEREKKAKEDIEKYFNEEQKQKSKFRTTVDLTHVNIDPETTNLILVDI